jgi:integrase
MYAIRLLVMTGCRLNEILTLKWDEVDLANQCLRLSDSKTGKKLVYLSQVTINILQAVPKKPDNSYVICGDKEGAHLVNLQKTWRRIRAKAGLI